MDIEIQLTPDPIPKEILSLPATGANGAWLEFRGVVRGEENGGRISALEYEAYPEMAAREIRRLLQDISSRHPCLAAKIIHRIGIIPVGETAIYAGIASSHRAEGIALLSEFMDRLKQDVPIWKRRAVPFTGTAHRSPSPPHEPYSRSNDSPSPLPSPAGRGRMIVRWIDTANDHSGSGVQCAKPSGKSHPDPLPSHPMGAEREQRLDAGPHSEDIRRSPAGSPQATTLDEALAKISSRCAPLPAISVPLEECFGYVLRETVCAPVDFPDWDRSTRDGYAILEDDTSETFQIVDTLHAADWKPRQLKVGEAVRVATGSSMPGSNLRVIMQENVGREGDRIRVAKRDSDLNIRRRGEEKKAGAPLVHAGERLDAGHLALLASAGCVRPVVSPRLRVVHFTTGDEVVPPGQTPKPGQIRDSNSILVHGLLESFPCDLLHGHLREDFEMATAQIKSLKEEMERADIVLISGGASVGEKDFTRPLLESLGFEIVFGKVAIRPGRPTIFGVNSRRIAFGLPGNPLAHFVCFHLFVAPALAILSGGEAKRFLRGKLAERLEDAPNPRETLWPARFDLNGSAARLRPLNWSSSGDVTNLTQANALLRVPPNCNAMDAGAELEFLPCW
jgi:molybdopterin molybdotransferase